MEYLMPQPPPGAIQPMQFWSEAATGAGIGALAGPWGAAGGAAIGGIGSLILGGPGDDEEEDDYEEDDDEY